MGVGIEGEVWVVAGCATGVTGSMGVAGVSTFSGIIEITAVIGVGAEKVAGEVTGDGDDGGASGGEAVVGITIGDALAVGVIEMLTVVPNDEGLGSGSNPDPSTSSDLPLSGAHSGSASSDTKAVSSYGLSGSWSTCR